MTSKFNGDFLVQAYTYDKIFTKIRFVFQEIWAKLWKTPHLAVLRNPSNNSCMRTRSGWLPKCNRFLSVRRYICGNIFTTIRSEVLREVAKRQIDERRALHNLLGGGNKWSLTSHILITSSEHDIAFTCTHKHVHCSDNVTVTYYPCFQWYVK